MLLLYLRNSYGKIMWSTLKVIRKVDFTFQNYLLEKEKPEIKNITKNLRTANSVATTSEKDKKSARQEKLSHSRPEGL